MSTQMITNPPVLDTTGQAIVAALNNLTEATSPTNVYIDIPLSIPVSGWDDNTPHVYTWMNENIVGNCGIEVGFADGAEDVATTFIRVTKIVGGIKFSIDEVPSAPIPLIVRIINAKADSVIGDIDATMVETSAISGVTNVEEALTDLDGRVDDNADDIASNSTAIAKLNSADVVQIGSLDALKTSLNNIASGMTTGTSAFYSMIATANFSVFSNNHIYAGYLRVTFKSSSSVRFVIELSDSQGNVIVVGNEVGTWTIQQLATKGTRTLIGYGTPAASLNLQLSQSIQNFDSVQIIFTKGNTNGCFLERTIPKDNYAAGSGDTIGIGAYNNNTYHAYVECGFTGNSNFYIATYNVAGWTLSNVYIVGLK